MESKLLFYDIIKNPINKNISNNQADNTFKIRCTLCPHNCILIERQNYTTKVLINDDTCPSCKHKINIIL